MGYDMHIVDADPVKGRIYLPHNKEYFRLNISDMSICLAFMGAMGLLDAEEGHGKFVSKEGYANTDAHDEWGDPVKVSQFFTDQRAMKSKRSPISGQVPSFKFDSNDGWVVTSEECVVIADAVDNFLINPRPVTHEGWRETVTYENPPEWLKGWGEYARRATQYGGFEVY